MVRYWDAIKEAKRKGYSPFDLPNVSELFMLQMWIMEKGIKVLPTIRKGGMFAYKIHSKKAHNVVISEETWADYTKALYEGLKVALKQIDDVI